MRSRLDRLFGDAEYDALFIMNTSERDSNFSYLTGFTSGLFEESMLIVERDGIRLLTSKLEEEAAREQADRLIDVRVVSGKDSLRDELRGLNGKVVGIDESFIPVSYSKFISKYARPKRLVDASKSFGRARSIKSRYEIERIRKAVRITKSALVRVEGYLEEGVTERMLAARFEYIQAEIGARPSFDSIVAFGKSAALPHYAPGNRKLRSNEVVLFDVGGIVDNYCSDISRTFIFKPDKSSSRCKRLLDMIDVVREAQMRGLGEMYDGNDAREPHRVASDYIDEYKGGIYKGRFIHALGHSIGIDVHDGDVIPSNMVLKTGMVFSDEPGVYINGLGGVRIEDDVLIGKGSSRFF